MTKHRQKRKSGAMSRYLKSPLNDTRVLPIKSEKVKVSNPIEEFEKEEAEKAKPFEIKASHLPETKPENQITEVPQISIELPAEQSSMTDENSMPLYCNYCDLQKQCPDGKGVVRKDQTKLVICKRRNDFRRLIVDAGTNDRQGLLAYIHKLRSINAVRIGRMIYKEALSGGGQDRYLSLLIDKQIDNAMSEYKLITPQDKGVQNFSYHLTHIHNTVDAYNELPLDVKAYLLQALKLKLSQVKSPTNRIAKFNNNTFLDTNLPDITTNNNIPNTKDSIIALPYAVGEAEGKVAGGQGEADSIDVSTM